MHTKAQLEKLSKARLVSLLMFLLAITKQKAPGAYKQAEKKAHIAPKRSGKKSRRKRKKRAGRKKGSKKRASPAQMRARRKFAARVRNARKLMKAGYRGSYKQALAEYG